MTKPEQRARRIIDKKLQENQWKKLDDLEGETGYKEEVITTGGNQSDYVLYENGVPCAIVEAKKQSINPKGKMSQPLKYAEELTDENRYKNTYSVPFIYVSNGERIFFKDLRSKTRRSREIYTFHTPSNLRKILSKDYSEIMKKIDNMESDDIDRGLWEHQKQAFNRALDFIHSGDNSFYFHMATGTGKTRLAMALSYGLLEAGYASNVLFAVDTGQLRTETKSAYESYNPAGSRPITDNYIVGNLDKYENRSKDVDIVITTTQKLQRRLSKQNHNYTIGDFDLVIADECHRGVYNDEGLAKSLNYFDALEIGLTATPHEKTKKRYNKNMCFSYDYNDALDDGYVSPFKAIEIATKLTNKETGPLVGKVNPENKIIKDTHRKISERLKNRINLQDDLTLIFAKDDQHAQSIVDHLREFYRDEFQRPNQEIKKVTSKAYRPEESLSNFKNPFRAPHIIVTVRMVTTGVDVRPLDNIVLMRNVNSKILFNQMIGRGTRTHETKDFFRIFDCAGNFRRHEGLPPFATEKEEYKTKRDYEIQEEKKDNNVEVIQERGMDEIEIDTETYESRKEHKDVIDKNEFLKELYTFIRTNRHKISEEIKKCKSVEEADEKIRWLLPEEWKNQTGRIKDLFDGVDSLYIICVGIIEGNNTMGEKAREAKRETIEEFSLDEENQKEVIETISDRAITEKREIKLKDFYNPPICEELGFNEAEKRVGDNELKDIISYFNERLIMIKEQSKDL